MKHHEFDAIHIIHLRFAFYFVLLCFVFRFLFVCLFVCLLVVVAFNFVGFIAVGRFHQTCQASTNVLVTDL